MTTPPSKPIYPDKGQVYEIEERNEQGILTGRKVTTTEADWWMKMKIIQIQKQNLKIQMDQRWGKPNES